MPKTSATIPFAAARVGEILHWLEYDAAIDVLGWSQNCPGHSPVVEIRVASLLFPREWQDAELELRITPGDVIKFEWSAVAMDGSPIAVPLVRRRLKERPWMVVPLTEASEAR